NAHEVSVDMRFIVMGSIADGGARMEQDIADCPDYAVGFGTGNGKDVFFAFGLVHARRHVLGGMRGEWYHYLLFLRLLITIADPYLFAGKDRKSTRLNSSHVKISYAVFC